MTETRKDLVKRITGDLTEKFEGDDTFRANIISKLNSDARFLLDPEGYAAGAASAISNQLKTARGAKRINTLKLRLKQWELALSVLKDETNER